MPTLSSRKSVPIVSMIMYESKQHMSDVDTLNFCPAE